MFIFGFLFVLASLQFGQAVWPSFSDPLLGTLDVSETQFPFLTQRRNRGRVHVFPTDEQLEKIRAAVPTRGKRHTGFLIGQLDVAPDFFEHLPDALQRHAWRKTLLESGLLTETNVLELDEVNVNRTKRQAEEADGPPDFDAPDDPVAAFNKFARWQEFLGKFLKTEFSMKYLGSDSSYDPSVLPFDRIEQSVYTKYLHLKENRLMEYQQEDFLPNLQKRAEGKPWIPAEKLARELRTCYYTDYASATDEDLKYDKNVGGTLVFYKLSCIRMGTKIYIGLALYENSFSLTDIRHVDRYEEKKSYFGGLWSKSTPKEKVWYEKRYLTLHELELLRDYILGQVGQHIRGDYGTAVEKLSGSAPAE